ncbi:MAG TPA: methyltransferase domain-containing protein [Alphaproteobacteria bacterium]|nr:methyltransferase domain-containing protein [Alphaproteobacteria bacterium]
MFSAAVRHHKAGRLDQAAAAYHDVLRQTPGHADAMHLLAVIEAQQGRLHQAIPRLQEAARLKPRNPEIRLNLANALLGAGQANQALEAYRAALTIRPDFAEARASLLHAIRRIAAFLESENRAGEAIPLWREAISLAPDKDAHWSGLAGALENVAFVKRDPLLHDVLLQLLGRSDVNPNSFYYAILSYLRVTPGFTEALAAAEAPAEIPGGDLFTRLLHTALVADPEIERSLTRWRAAALKRIDSGERSGLALEFLSALAAQCFATEYVYSESAGETAAVERLIAALAQGTALDPERLAVLATYRPLHRFAVPAQPLPQALGPVVQRQITEPREEQSLRGTIPTLTPVDDSVSRAVREQYEENPYPRWLSVARPRQAMRVAERLGVTDPKILIAGCGTGSHPASTAMRFPSAHVVAVDLSLTSLAYAKRRSRELGLERIEYAQADILELGRLQRRFDIVESVGVLHHLGDPLAGWRVLIDLVRPGGLMLIGLYSELGRRPIVAARAFIAEHGFDASADGIRRARQAILDSMEGWVVRRLRTNVDFYSISGCRDLLFHVQEHRFTIPQIAQALDQLGLSFIGFDPLDYAVVMKFRARFPADPEMRSLANWEVFEQDNPNTFASMYQFWLRKPASSET